MEHNHNERPHAILSASSSGRWLKCPPSAMIAQTYPSADNEFTREGTLAHEVAEFITRSNPAAEAFMAAREAVTKEMLDCAEAYRDYLQELITDENAVVLLEQRVDFSEWVPDGFGTADCIIIQGNRMDIVDYKYGQGVAVSAVGNSQMRLYALGALAEFGDIYDIQEIGMHIFQPRKNNVSVDTVMASFLLEWGLTVVKPIAGQAAKGGGNFMPGEHCKFCPHAGACPTLAAACVKVVNLAGGTVAVPTLEPWMVADILNQEPIISSWIKAVKDRALAQMLAGEDIPGYKVVEGRSIRHWADEEAVKTTLLGVGYDLDAITETSLLGISKMEKLIGKKQMRELLTDYVEKKPGAPTIAPETDKRDRYDQKEASRRAFE